MCERLCDTLQRHAHLFPGHADRQRCTGLQNLHELRLGGRVRFEIESVLAVTTDLAVIPRLIGLSFNIITWLYSRQKVNLPSLDGFDHGQ